ncbi:hypothetical protein EKO04_009442 [Ascochyta lentis]|uniref:Uncharacterized protein n=1 Tax=Ascochyta lentis TaxID=205686 RepID=A0A8H7IVY4_9PLEO|nr:hypothetical protein EKO04_009442 [Ascochyta lentis]
MNTVALTMSALQELNEEWERISPPSSSPLSNPILIDLDSKSDQRCEDQGIINFDLDEDNTSCAPKYSSTNSDVSYLDLNGVHEDDFLDGEEDRLAHKTDHETECPTQERQNGETQVDQHTVEIGYFLVTVSRSESEVECEIDVLEFIFTILFAFSCIRLYDCCG